MTALAPRLLALIPLAVGINLAMGQFAAATALPLFLDTVGTILVAALAGLVPALAAGLVSQIVFTMVSGNATWLAFLPVLLAVGAAAALAARRGLFGSTARALASGLGLGLVAATFSWPISYLAFGGVTAGGVTVVTALLTGAGVPLKWAVYAASLSNDLLDKTVSFLLVRMVLVSLPVRIAAGFPATARALGRA
ncbi:MAG: ECF transporter S component [Gemmatimonadetes bacterium]|nr:ECF transporter S component [Gemmatimonadota bacterium]